MKKLLTAACAALMLCLSTAVTQAADSDFRVKGFHIDFRAEIMTLQAMKDFAKQLSGMGINAIVMEWEATFPYTKNATISNKLAFKPEEVKEFIDYCATLGIDVIPLQQCFGHVEYILRHQRYNKLKEDFRSELSQVCPLKPGSVELFRELFTEIAAAHPSPYLHIGGDETYLLGLCPKCSKFIKEEGKSKLFVDYIKQMCDIVISLGKRPVLWADIITKYPKAVEELPKEAILVDWNYGWDIRHFGDIDKIYSSGLEIWGAPSIRSSPDNYYLTNWPTHFNNQRDFIPYARKVGYKGIIMTSWSTSGHYGFLWEPRNEVVVMDPVRTVYPMNGFNILIEMYGKAINQEQPVDPKKFAIEYSQERFGFTEEQAGELWKILSTSQLEIRDGKAGKSYTIEQERDKAIDSRNRLYAMSPKANKTEYDHFKLMLDIRVQYLEFKVLENIINSDSFDRTMAAGLLAEFDKKVLAQTKDLNKRFIALHKGYLKEPELAYLNDFRMRKINNTVESLKRML